MPPIRLLAHLSVLALVGTFTESPAFAETVWERAKQPSLSREERVLRSLYRTLAGTGDALDQMAARTAFVDLARGKKFERHAIVVLLLRLRRQLGLEPDRRSLELLSPTEGQRLPRTVLAMGELESAHVLLAWGEAARAETKLTAALRLTWWAELRSEILLLRGWLRFDAGDFAEASRDFEAIAAMDVGRRRLAVTLMSLACVREAVGDLAQARILLARGQAVERSRAQASGMPLFSGEGLHPQAVTKLEGLSTRLQESEPESDVIDDSEVDE